MRHILRLLVVLSFVLMTVPALAQASTTPDLIAPTGVVTDSIGNPEFIWSYTGESVQLYVGEEDDSMNIIRTVFFKENITLADSGCDGSIVLPQCSIRLPDLDASAWLSNGKYVAYMNATNGTLTSWSNAFRFEINSPQPSAVTILSTAGTVPNNPPVPATMSPFLHWNLEGAATNAAYFQIYLAPTADISNPLVVDKWVSREEACVEWTGTVCNWTVDPALATGARYNFYVQSWGPGGLSTGGLENSGWAEGAFNLGGPEPAVPSGFEIVPGLSPAVRWDDDPTTIRYVVFIVMPNGQTILQEASKAEANCDGAKCTWTVPLADAGINIADPPRGTYTVYVQPLSAGGERGDGILGLGWFEVLTFDL